MRFFRYEREIIIFLFEHFPFKVFILLKKNTKPQKITTVVSSLSIFIWETICLSCDNNSRRLAPNASWKQSLYLPFLLHEPLVDGCIKIIYFTPGKPEYITLVCKIQVSLLAQYITEGLVISDWKDYYYFWGPLTSKPRVRSKITGVCFQLVK